MSLSVMENKGTGQDVRTANNIAIQAVASILKSSLGPHGLDKMLVDDIGDVTITNDGATILKRLEIVHPASKILVDLADLQDQEVGDGTTSVVLLAAELLKQAIHLVKSDLHPTTIIAGYKVALKEALKYIDNNLTIKIEQLGKDVLCNVAKTSLSSKFIGTDDALFANLIVDAITSVKFVNDMGVAKYPISAVSVLKTHGKGSSESSFVDGYALSMGRAAQGMPTSIKNAKIALLDFNLRQHRMQLGINIQIDDPKALEQIRQKEKDITRDRIKKVLATGANVIATTQGIDDMSLKYFIEAGAIALRRVDKKDMRRLSKITGATICLTLSTLEGDEKYDAGNLGFCDEVYEDRLGDSDYIFFKGCKTSKSATIILRGSSEFMLDEFERSVHDGICCVSRALENNLLCAGGGAVEVAVSTYLEDFAKTLGSRQQLAIAAFAEALLVIPRTLALNSSSRLAGDQMNELRYYHSSSQNYTQGKQNEDYKWYGFNIGKNLSLRDNIKDGLIETAISKSKALRFATEAAVTILRIDDVIKLEAKKEGE